MAKELFGISGKINMVNLSNFKVFLYNKFKSIFMHRFTNAKGIELIKYYEGFKRKAYICAGGHPTIGYGHKILKGEKFSTISLMDAQEILAKDLIRTERLVLRYIDIALHDNQFAALVSFTFNLGGAALQRSVLRQKVNYGLYKEAGREFLRWVYAGGKRLPGLAVRRRSERDLFLSDV